MKNNKFNMSFNKFLAGSLSVGFFGAGIVEAAPPKKESNSPQVEETDRYKEDVMLYKLYNFVDAIVKNIKNLWEKLSEKNKQSEQKKEEGEQKEFRSNFFDYKVVLDDLFENKNCSEILKSFEKMLGSESCALDDVNKLFNVLKVDNTVKDLEKAFDDCEFFKFCSKEAFNLVKMFFVSHKLKYFCESSSKFDFEKIFKTSSDREIGELFSKTRESLEEMISNCSDLCKSGKYVSNKFLESFQKSLNESMSYLKKIEKKYNEEHDKWCFSSGNVPLEENKNMNDQTRKSAERLCKIFQSSFGYDASKSLKGSDKFGINVHISKEFFDSHVQEAQCLNAANDIMCGFIVSEEFDRLKEIFKSEKEFRHVISDLEELLKSGLDGANLRREKNRIDFRGTHSLLLRKWQGLSEYYTKVFKVRCEEKFYDKPESKLVQLEFHFV